MRQRRQGFTLVELLVVIGIIALLISVLMPALNQARTAARQVACQSNFKQIFNAILFYSNSNQGFLPYANHPASFNQTHELNKTGAGTYLELTQLMGGTNTDPLKTEAEVSPVFRCTEAGNPDDGIVWAAGLVRTVLFHPRAFPNYESMINNGNSASTHFGQWPQRKLATIRNTGEKIAFWEGPQAMNWNMTTPPTAVALDGWRWSFGHRFLEEGTAKDSWDTNNRTRPIVNGTNRDLNNWMNDFNPPPVVRYRHNKNKNTVVGFFDGHVETRPEGSIKNGEIRITGHTGRPEPK